MHRLMSSPEHKHRGLRKQDCCAAQEEEIMERHRRDGFEVGNADKIFESTSAARSKETLQPMAGYGKDLQMEAESGRFKAAAKA